MEAYPAQIKESEAGSAVFADPQRADKRQTRNYVLGDFACTSCGSFSFTALRSPVVEMFSAGEFRGVVVCVLCGEGLGALA